MINKEIRNNILDILVNFAQMKHLDYFKELGIKKKRKRDTINALLDYLGSNEDIMDEFKEWLQTLTMDGYNSYYVFDFNGNLRKNKEEILNQSITDITLVNKENIKETKLIYLNYKEDKQKIIARYVSPADVVKYYYDDDGNQQIKIEKSLYFANIYVDIERNQIIVAIHPTKDISNIEKMPVSYREYKQVAVNYLNKATELFGIDEIVDCKEWIYKALNSFAEEASHHNNPDITAKCTEASNKIDNFVELLLNESGIATSASKQYMKEEINILFENILAEEYGVIEIDDSYSLCSQNGEGVNSFVKVGSKTSALKVGRESAIAKSSRNNSDLALLCVMKQIDGNMRRFVIEVEENAENYIVKTDTSIYIEEKVIYDVIRKVSSYKPMPTK